MIKCFIVKWPSHSGLLFYLVCRTYWNKNSCADQKSRTKVLFKGPCIFPLFCFIRFHLRIALQLISLLIQLNLKIVSKPIIVSALLYCYFIHNFLTLRSFLYVCKDSGTYKQVMECSLMLIINLNKVGTQIIYKMWPKVYSFQISTSGNCRVHK